MEYLIHVIDESSQHKKKIESDEFSIVEGRSENGETGDIVRSDAFYIIVDNSPVDALISITNIVKVKDSDNNLVPISSVLSKSNIDSENSSIEDDTFLPIKVSELNFVENTNSELFKVSCQIKRINGDESWIELHNICFFVIPREKVVFVK